MEIAELQKDFGERRIKILGLAVNTKTTIEKWVSATEELSDVRVEFPIVADSDAVIASTIGMVRHGQPPHPKGVLHASMVLIVNPNNRVEVIQQYPEAVGRNFHEVLRAVDALNMTFLHTHVSTGGNWASGEDVVIDLMEDHSPSKQCGWDIRQVARSGGDQIGAGSFWWHAQQHGWRCRHA